MRQPTVVTRPGLPDRVRIVEVGPRDGLQNESTVLDVQVKAEFVRRLLAAGLPTVETTSFVHPRWVPQLADATELLEVLRTDGGPMTTRPEHLPVLVPNEKGLDRALAAGVREIAVFASATQTFARRNLNCTYEEQFAMFEPVVRRAREEGVRVRGYLSMCFGDPWEGAVPVEDVTRAAQRLLRLGVAEVSLGDTIGVGTPGHVRAVLRELVECDVDLAQIAVHFHDTYGQALANAYAALVEGVTVFDASAGGLGGCPYAESATGNLATEDLVWMLHGLGVGTGVDLKALAGTSRWMAEQLGRPSPSRVVAAV
ncbi:hydroxymethylglutaryl-CoA lyase [Nocardioidaceae bacterium]|nr:hydroxymethylglutaryl-CoA lyase [Nocardioidaceae bacterium]